VLDYLPVQTDAAEQPSRIVLDDRDTEHLSEAVNQRQFEPPRLSWRPVYVSQAGIA
jgi:hypothetical protein